MSDSPDQSEPIPPEPTLKDESVRERHHRMIFWMMQSANHVREALGGLAKAMALHEGMLQITGDMPTEEQMKKVVDQIVAAETAPKPPKPRIIRP